MTQKRETASRSLLVQAANQGIDKLLTDHVAAWRRTWQPVTIELPEQPHLELALRLGQFHLISSVGSTAESAVGARGLTGPAYRGHVFWDTDVFVVPVLSATSPPRARSALRYRWNRLGAARRRAAAEGRRGARFPWESAAEGIEATPPTGTDLHGRRVHVRTGEMEEHIVADIAWAVVNYGAWTADEAFLRNIGAEILCDTARYWQSRVEVDADGTGHIRGVIGPDEYHEGTDDNAYTNLMAQWNLRQAAEVAERLDLGLTGEAQAWRTTADRVFDGYDEVAGFHEQFDGFFDLEPLMATSLGHPPLPADSLLGHERIQQVQVIKQPDVLMAHHLIPDAIRPTLAAELDYYLPRTAHGSSLSPAISAALLATDGRIDHAVRWFELAGRFDLDDAGRTTAGGVHLATMGGLWQAFTQGFLGIRPTRDGLLVNPRGPPVWGRLTHRFLFRSQPVEIVATSESFEFRAPKPIAVLISDGEVRTGSRIAARRFGARWEFL